MHLRRNLLENAPISPQQWGFVTSRSMVDLGHGWKLKIGKVHVLDQGYEVYAIYIIYLNFML